MIILNGVLYLQFRDILRWYSIIFKVHPTKKEKKNTHHLWKVSRTPIAYLYEEMNGKITVDIT